MKNRISWQLTPVALLLLLWGVAVLTHWQMTYSQALRLWDSSRYLALARVPLGSPDPHAHEAPYLWRLLTPLLAHAALSIGVPLAFSFSALTLIGLVGAVLALQWFLQGLRATVSQAAMGGIAFVLFGPATGALLVAPYRIDPLAMALLTVALAATVHQSSARRPLALAMGRKRRILSA